MKKTPFELESEIISKAFGEDFLEKLYQHDMENGGDKEDITPPSIMDFVKKVCDKTKYKYLMDRGMISSNHFKTQLLHTYQFYKYGKKVFRFEKNLTEMLMKTDLKNVDSEFFKPPFTSIFIEVPSKTFKKEIQGKEISLYGLYLYDYPVDYKERETLDKEIGPEVNKVVLIQCIYTEEDEISSAQDTSFSFFTVKLKPGNLFDQLQEILQRLGKDSTEMEVTKDIVSFVVNAILYLNSDKKVINLIEPTHLQLLENKKSPKKIKKLEKKYKNYSKLPYYQVGKDIVIDNKLGKKSTGNSKKNIDDSVHSTQWIVRGHWRNQAYGEGRKERKYIWIKPYVKGNEEGTLTHPKYRVK